MEGIDRLRQYLDQHHTAYEITGHPRAYTAPEVAAVTHVQGKMMAKVVIAVSGEEKVMLVLPSTSHVDLTRLRAVLGKEARLAHEAEFSPLFPDCEPGAMPPFGNLYGLPVYVDRALAQEPTIVFQAGTHRHTISLRFEALVRLVRPTIADFGDPMAGDGAQRRSAHAVAGGETRAW
jgi:Ala-tRNA(Pro) deacylase